MAMDEDVQQKHLGYSRRGGHERLFGQYLGGPRVELGGPKENPLLFLSSEDCIQEEINKDAGSSQGYHRHIFLAARLLEIYC